MKREVITCDVCGKERDSVGERWFKVRLETVTDNFNTVRLICEPFSFGGEGKEVCGDICALRMVGRWLEHGNLEEGEPLPVKARSA